MKKSLLTIFASFSLFLSAFAQIPSGYYDGANGKSAAALKTALFQIIHNYISADYDGFTATYWGDTYFVKTDWNSAGYYWDMYSDKQRSTYNSDSMSREHCMPRSWWGTSADYGVANSDLNNLYPSDYAANSKKSNLPLGEVGTVSWTNGTVKIGANTYSGYSGTVFEPADEYKGDYARTYFYMVTSHEDYADRWQNDGITSMLDNNTYPVFQSWAINMLLDWARQDPVSQKEIDRNNAVFAIQQNRNPFIDYPDLFEYIWGSKTGDTFTVTDQATSATLITPEDGISIDFGSIKTSVQKTRIIPVKTRLLSGNLSVEWLENESGYFSLNSTTMTGDSTNSLSGDTLKITYSPSAAGTQTAKLRIYNTESGLSSTVSVSGTAYVTNTVDPVTPDEDADLIFFYKGPWDKGSLPSNFTTNISAVYSNGDLKFSATGNYLTVTFDQSPDYMRFAIYPRNAWGTNQNHLYVYEGTSASTIGSTAIADFDNAFMTTGDSYNNTPAISLKEDTRAIKIEYSKVSQNVGINNLFVTLKSSSSLNETSELNSANIYKSGNYIVVDAVSTMQPLLVYNLWGELIYQGNIENGSKVFFPYKGIFVAKIGTQVKKLVF